MIPAGAWAIGREISDLELDKYRVIITAIRRHGIRGPSPLPNTLIRERDTLVLRGYQSSLGAAEIRLMTVSYTHLTLPTKRIV